jgi:hypothetical protein
VVVAAAAAAAAAVPSTDGFRIIWVNLDVSPTIFSTNLLSWASEPIGTASPLRFRY